MGNFSLEVADQNDRIRDSLITHFRTWSAVFEACIAEAQSAGEVENRAPASVLAQFVLNSWQPSPALSEDDR